jgi:hypothetical protein
MVYFHTKIPIWVYLEGLRIENGAIFYDQFKYFAAIWYILWQFGIVCSHLVYFSDLGMFGQEKSGNTA